MKTNIKVIHNIDKDFLRQWEGLWRESPHAHFFNSPEWFLAYIAVCPETEYRILSVEHHGELQAVLPLIHTMEFGISMFSSPGGKFLDKSTLLLRKKDEKLLTMLVQELVSMGNFYLHELPDDLADMIVEADPRLVRRQASINSYINLQPDPFIHVSRKQNSKITNKMKKNKDHLVYKRYVGDPEGLRIAFAIEQKSAKKHAGKMTFTTKRDKDFFRQLLKRKPEDVVVDVVSYDGVPFVYQIGFLYGKTCQGVNTAYDRNYRHLSPGKVLLYFMLEHLQQQQMEIFDFSRGESVLKKEFTDLSYVQYDVFYTQNSAIKLWLLLCKRAYNFVLEHKKMYDGYLMVKRQFVRVIK